MLELSGIFVCLGEPFEWKSFGEKKLSGFGLLWGYQYPG